MYIYCNLTLFLGNLIHKDSDEAKDQAQGIVQTEPQESTGIYVFFIIKICICVIACILKCFCLYSEKLERYPASFAPKKEC